MKVVSPTVLDNLEMTFNYNGKHRHGIVETVRHCEKKGYLLTVKTDEGYRSCYLAKISGMKVIPS